MTSAFETTVPDSVAYLDRLAAGPFLATATLHIVVADAPGHSSR